uniref:Uncharacterized protein n=1 Tax=Ascaris lumbricoides TaxID=6252 RepID=A0A0M3HWQ3_ASCLU
MRKELSWGCASHCYTYFVELGHITSSITLAVLCHFHHRTFPPQTVPNGTLPRQAMGFVAYRSTFAAAVHLNIFYSELNQDKERQKTLVKTDYWLMRKFPWRKYPNAELHLQRCHKRKYPGTEVHIGQNYWYPDHGESNPWRKRLVRHF